MTNQIKNVAVIMDGNGRWAKKKGLPRTAGHLQGTKNIRNITIAANDLGIKSLTLYAFSTENWKREQSEVEYIMKLPAQFLDDYLEELIENNVVIKLIGERDRLPEYTRKPIEEAEARTAHNNGIILNLCLNYGGQREIVLAVKQMIADGVKEEEVTEDLFASYLMAANCNPIDLLIRTSGEQRISNFLLWQIAYSELYFTDKLWPDFTAEDFKEAILNFDKRERRFGGR
ncbi:MAG: isoprenyl transferase [Erysipelotrichales bacterium]|nr:isoprenyl transferase [Erysipelotrichales bacterium]